MGDDEGPLQNMSNELSHCCLNQVRLRSCAAHYPQMVETTTRDGQETTWNCLFETTLNCLFEVSVEFGDSARICHLEECVLANGCSLARGILWICTESRSVRLELKAKPWPLVQLYEKRESAAAKSQRLLSCICVRACVCVFLKRCPTRNLMKTYSLQKSPSSCRGTLKTAVNSLALVCIAGECR